MKPLPPSSLCVTYLGTDSVVIEWSRPYSDGDSPLLHYVIEKRDSGKSTWEHLTNLPPDVTECELDNMTTNKVYYMRVRAANKFGLSDPKDLDQPVKLKGDKRGDAIDSSVFSVVKFGLIFSLTLYIHSFISLKAATGKTHSLFQIGQELGMYGIVVSDYSAEYEYEYE